MRKREALRLLKKVRNILSTEDKWTQGWYAKDKVGNHRNVVDIRAVCWCLSGAISKAAFENKMTTITDAKYVNTLFWKSTTREMRNIILEDMNNAEIVSVINDHHDISYLKIKKWLDRTIKLVETNKA